MSVLKPTTRTVLRRVLFLFSMFTLLIPQLATAAPPGPFNYTKNWKKVDSLSNKGLYQSALDLSNTIYKTAKTDNNAAQIVKSLIHRYKFMRQIEENADQKSIEDLQNELKTANTLTRPVLHSILADLYWGYCQNNRWRFYYRTQTVNFKREDMATWDANTLVNQVIKEYNASLEQADTLKKITINLYDPILTIDSVNRSFRPTLYDFIAHRAVDFYMNEEPSITRPADQFLIRDAAYLNDAVDFSRLPLLTTDTMSLDYYAMRTLQGLISFHLNDADPAALVDVDLKRIHYIHSHLERDDKDALLLSALTRLDARYYDKPVDAEIRLSLASFYNNTSGQYNALQGTDHKNDLRMALTYCDDVIKRFPGSYGASNCAAIRSSILNKSVTFQADEVVPANKPAFFRISYRNMTKVYVRIVRMGGVHQNRNDYVYYKTEEERMRKRYLGLPVVQTMEFDLPNDSDYQTHSTDLKFDGLPYGQYAILVSAEKDFPLKKNSIAYQELWCSNISFVRRESSTTGKHSYLLVDRETGAPLKGVTAQVWIEKYSYTSRKYVVARGEKLTADENGMVTVNPPTDDYKTYYLEVTNGTDKFYTDYQYQYKHYDRDKEFHATTNFFLDRSIYRPGQTIYFKGILSESDGETTRLLKHKMTTVILYDANYQQQGSLTLTSNEFGTVSGTFTAPMGLLNGYMHLGDGYGTTYFSVEEYKRPKFEVLADPMKGSYRLNDSVSVSGHAKAFAGSNIDGAKVKYRVTRRAVFPYWWWCWRGYYPSSPAVEIANGYVTSNDTGGFVIKFKALPDGSVPKESRPTYTYEVSFDVTDISGETRSVTSSVRVGYASIELTLGVEDQMERDSLKQIKITANNLGGQPEPTKGTITAYLLKAPASVFRDRLWARTDHHQYSKEEWAKWFPNDPYDNENDVFKWEKGDKVLDASFDTGKDKIVKLPDGTGWKSGKYMIEVLAKDKYGEEVKEVRYITVYHDGDNNVPASQMDWFTALKDAGEPGEKAVFLAGSADTAVKVLLEVEHKGEIVRREWINLSGRQQRIEIPIEEKHRGNFSVHMVFIHHNRSYIHSSNITVPWSNKELDLHFETFRDKLIPGQPEEWKLKIKGPKGEKVAAEMVAAMYDASLDAFRANSWYLNFFRTLYSELGWMQGSGFGSGYSSQYTSSDWNMYAYGSYRYYDRLNWFNFYYGGRYYGYTYGWDFGGGEGDYWSGNDRSVRFEDDEVTLSPRGGSGPFRSSRGNASHAYAETAAYAVDLEKSKEEADGNYDYKNVNKKADSLKQQTEGFGRFGTLTKAAGGKDGQPGYGGVPEEQTNLENVAARKNLNETAFFFPQLQTDEQGNIVMKFTMPEALTRWKFMALAHTQDLSVGRITKEVVTQKDLMVMPNNPRFFREGDKIEFTAKVSNLAEKEISGSAQLMLFDPATNKPIDALFGNSTAKINFTAKKGGSAPLSWTLTIPEGVSAVTVRVVAASGIYTDGEESVLPVLTNRMLVTETMPLPIRSMQTKTFTFDKFISQSNASTTLRNHKFTLEYTSNPAWYAVQSLPYLMEYPYECAEQTFSRFYANSIATHIANSSPKIKAVFDTWRTQQPDALLSNLEKNQELKSALLEETPWVLDAKDETERKRRVAILFDLTRMSNELSKASEKLRKMQASNGGWPWFEGGPDDRYITQHIITGMGHLDHLGVTDIRNDSKTWNMVREGVRYLDDRIDEDYDWIVRYDKEHLDDDHLGQIEIQYLYARSFFKDISVQNSNQKAFDYYLGQAKKYWTGKGRYMQGMIALALFRNGEKTVAADIMKSLSETALHSDELGMYWKENNASYYWYEAPIESQALMIEAFDEVSNDTKAVDDLRVWLLKNKQTNDWKTTKATTEACYALLLRGTGWLATESNVSITLGNLTVDPKNATDTKAEAGTGYFKTSWTGDDIKTDMGKITVTKRDSGVSWGAVYWQYFENLDKITSAETPLKLQKKLFLEKNTASGPVLEPITDQTVLKPGDKVKVRIELRVDRAMEYVHMKDMRASCFEPINVFSQYKWQDGLGYYESTRDAATNFFFSQLPKGTYVFEYPLVVTHAGDFSNGITTIQSMYAPEFTSHSEGVRVKVTK